MFSISSRYKIFADLIKQLTLIFVFLTNCRAQPYITDDGRIRVIGYNDMQHCLEAVNSVFLKSHPNIKFSLELKGTKLAPLALANNSSALAPMGSEMTNVELTIYKNKTQDQAIAFRVAHASLSNKAKSGPLVIIVNKNNPLKTISLNQLRRLYTPDLNNKQITKWGELSLSSEWQNKTINILGLSPVTALGEYLLDRPFMSKRYSSLVRGYEQSSDICNEVAKDTQAIGFCRSNIVNNSVNILGLESSDNIIYPTYESIKSGTYPLDRFLLIYVKVKLLKENQESLREYIEFILSSTGQEAMASTSEHYIPLNSSEINCELNKIKSL